MTNKEAEQERIKAKVYATLLTKHLLEMLATAVETPVIINDEKYIFTASIKAKGEEL